MEHIFKAAIQHQGFSLVNVFSPCVTFNKVNTYDSYKETLADLDNDSDDDCSDHQAAMAVVTDYSKEPVGILYHNPALRVTYEAALPGFSATGLATADLSLDPEYLEGLLAELR